MKNGIYRISLLLLSFTALNWLSACASLFNEGSSRDLASEYDRGYQAEDSTDGIASACNGRFCETRNEANGTEPNDDMASRTNYAIHARDVVLGMTRTQVLQSWGEPKAKEVAGDGQGGHERWHYGSKSNLNGERIVIFEEGRVAGWYH